MKIQNNCQVNNSNKSKSLTRGKQLEISHQALSISCVCLKANTTSQMSDGLQFILNDTSIKFNYT